MVSRKNKNGSKSQSNKTEQVFGFHSVESIVSSNVTRIVEILIDRKRQDKRIQELLSQLDEAGVSYRFVDKDELNLLSEDAVHQGVIAFVKPVPQRSDRELERYINDLDRPILILVLDQVQDPHNLGACLRTADGAGVDAVIIPKNGSCPINQTVRKVAVGAVELLAIFHVTNLSRTLEALQQRGIWITGTADSEDRTIYQCDFTGDVAILMGSEGKGLRRLTMEKCDQLAEIPMHGSVSSLNVSVATGITLFEAIRQRSVGQK